MPNGTSTKPPYYRLSDDEYDSYFQRGFNRFEKMIGGSLLSQIGASDTKFDADVIGEATITPHDTLAPSIFTMYDLSEEEMRDYSDEPDPHDGETQRENFFAMFRFTTDEWRHDDVGPFRAAYFYHALTFGIYDKDHDLMRFGGFPPPVDEPFESHHFPSRGRTDVPVQTKNWLAYDIYLTDILGWLRVSWIDIEDALLSAYILALPLAYQKMLREQEVPGPLIPILWRHDFDNWSRLYQHKDKIITTAERLREIVKKIGYFEFLAPLNALIDLPEIWDWTKGSVVLQRQLLPYTKHNSPVLKATFKTLADALTDRVERGFGEGNFPNDAPTFVRRIYDAVAAGGGQRPAEFWQLCADIVYHLPILISRPPQYTPRGTLAPPACPTAEGFRSIVRTRNT
jgi:hypothetical protein